MDRSIDFDEYRSWWKFDGMNSMEKKNKPSDLFFDLDRTLWDFDRNSRDALQEIFEEIAAPVLPKSLNFGNFLRVYESENEKCWKAYREGKITQSELRSLRFRRSMSALNVPDFEGMDALSESLGSAYVKRAPYRTRLLPDALEVLSVLKKRGHRMYILTNGFEEVQHIKMQNSGLSPFFEKVFTSDALGYKKPHPETFNLCLKLTHSSPREAVMVGDDLECDVLGALKCGWRQVHFNPHGVRHEYQIWRTVNSLKSLLDLPLDNPC